MSTERPDKRPGERSTGGRFAKGNRAAVGRRGRRRTGAELLALADARLRELAGGRTLADFAADAVAAVASAAATGDLAAARWLVDRLYPVDPDALELPRLPSPSREPAGYVDALAAAVGRGELSPAKAASLAQLARAFLADEQLRAIAAEVQTLAAKVADLERIKEQGGRPRLVSA